MAQLASSVGFDELGALKLLALDGGLDGEVKVSCANLADRLGASNQTASRRLQHLEDAGTIERDVVSDGQWIALTDAGEQALRREYEAYRRIFEDRSTVELQGHVTTGMGEGRHYISLSGYMEQFRDRLGYEPFPGTLNVTLESDSVRRRSALEAIEPVRIDGWENEERTYGPAFCYPARVTNPVGEEYVGAHAIVPERTHHDEDNLELIAPDRLRDVLDLADDDLLTIYVGAEVDSE